MFDRMWADIPELLSAATLLFLLRGAANTIFLTALGCGLGLLGGFAAAIARQSTSAAIVPLRIFIIAYVELFRRVPFLVTLFLILFTAQAFVPGVPIFIIAATAITIMSTAYMAEIVRAGLESVPKAQVEAAVAMNFGFWRTIMMVVVPQSWPVILPPAVAYVVMFVKDTALASQVGVFEILFAGKTLINRGLDAFLVYGAVMLLYFAISFPLAQLGKRLERRLARRRLATNQVAPLAID